MNQLYIVFFIAFVCHIVQAQTTDTLIDVGGHRLHFSILKGKDIPILFEAGNGSDGSDWNPLLQQIYNSTGATLITYDRAGLGQSELDTMKISFKQEIKDLNNALAELGYKENYFLVAHSFGAFYASEFAKRKKRRIKGAVFIDAATPCELNEELAMRIKNSISEENWSLLKQYKIGLYYVLKKFPEIARYMSNRYISNNIPLTLIVAENYVPTKEIGETDEDMTKWKKCLQEFGALPNHKYVVTKNTDHKVWEKDPATVSDEIIKLYNQVIDK